MKRPYRLVEYVATIGIDEKLKESIEKMKGNVSSLLELQLEGRVLNRFPLDDHKDFPFPSGIVKFCIPNGWYIETKPKRPLFYSVVLTDIDGIYSFAAYIVWNQYIGKFDDKNTKTCLDIYTPKCMCIVSRLPYFDTFKECLMKLFNMLWINNPLETMTEKYIAESIVSSLISSPHIFEAGIDKIQFSLTNKHFIQIQPPLTTQFNSTRDDVYFLAKHLGVHNLIYLYNVLLLDSKILFVSSSYNFLFKACNGLVSLLYPLKFNYVFIPLLPKQLTDIINAPTPFMIGIHESFLNAFPVGSIGSDVVVVNVDTGNVKINSDHSVPEFSTNYATFLEKGLSRILFPKLNHPDELFNKPEHISNEIKDKKIRAYFLVFLIQLLKGYLSCTNVVRVYPNVLIKFQKDLFLYRRKLYDCQFTNKFLDTMLFNVFISERGVPYRYCDIFDDMMMRYDSLSNSDNNDFLDSFIQTATSTFMENERLLSLSQERSLQKHEFCVLEQSQFQYISLRDIETKKVVFTDNQTYPKQISYSTNPLSKMARTKTFIPLNINSYRFGLVYTVKIIEAEVIREFVRYVFEGQSPKALQIIQKVKSLGNQTGIRVLLCNELNLRLQKNYNKLDYVQFDLLCEVINEFLNNEDNERCFVMSSLVVDLSSYFYKKTKNNIVSLYTKLHGHKNWNYLPFWEALFYVSVQTQLISFYLTNRSLNSLQTPFVKENYSSYFVNEDLATKEMDPSQELAIHPHYDDVSGVMPIIADQLIKKEDLVDDKLVKIEKMEDELLFSTISLFITKILCMNLQMNEAHRYLKHVNDNTLENTEKFINSDSSKSINRNDSHQSTKPTDYKSICELMQKFISNVFVTLDFKYNASSQMVSRVSEIMRFHCESLDRIYSENATYERDISDIIKSPYKVPGEQVISVLNCSMLPEGVNNRINVMFNSTSILPANGIIFITQYRLCFFGYSLNPFASNYIVSRSIPFGIIKSLKTIDFNYCPVAYRKLYGNNNRYLDISLKPGGHVILGFPVESGQDKIDLFFKTVQKRYVSLLLSLEQNDNIVIDGNDLIGSGVDNGEKSERGSVTMSSKNIAASSRNSSIFQLDNDSQTSQPDCDSVNQQKESKQHKSKFFKVDSIKNTVKQRLKIFTRSPTKRMKSITDTSNSVTSNVKGVGGSSGSSKRLKNKNSLTEFKTLYNAVFDNESVSEEIATRKYSSVSLYIADYERMNLLICNITISLGSFLNCNWRLTLCNKNKLIPSLPEVFPVPFQITDEAVYRTSKSFKAKRLPVLSWMYASEDLSSQCTNIFSGALFRCASIIKSLNITSSKLQQSLGNSVSVTFGGHYSDLDAFFIHLATMSSKLRITNKVKCGKDILEASSESRLDLYLDIMDKLQRPHMLFLTSSEESYDVSDVSCHFSDLYIFGDKSFPRGVSDDKVISILNVEMPDASQIESAFRKLTKSLRSTKPIDLTVSSHLTLLSKSKWFLYIKKLLKLSSTIAFSIEYGESFSVVGYGDGSDTSAQVNSIVQILLDPFYRTIDGFQTLVEKEWLAFNHKFLLRNGVTNNANSIFFPIFLQFLDCVHQIMIQFPCAFEFNDYFLKFLAYHHLSNRFDTFITCSTRSFTNDLSCQSNDYSSDCFSGKSSIEKVKVSKNDFIVRDDKNNRPISVDCNTFHSDLQSKKLNVIDPSSVVNHRPSLISSSCYNDDLSHKETIWNYINRFRDKFPIFSNTYYIQGMYSTLYPCYHYANIELWEFYYQIPQLLSSDFYELEYVDTELFINSNSMFPHAECIKSSQSPLLSKTEISSNLDDNTNQNNFKFYSGASYLGYMLDNVPLTVDKFNYKLNKYIFGNAGNYLRKIGSILNFASVQAARKVARKLDKVNHKDELIVYELKYSSFFSIINTKRFFVSLISKDKTFYSKVNHKNCDHYFTQVKHDFVESPPSDHLICSHCSKPLSGKYNYYNCQKCNLNVHTKCSKNVSQICNMGDNGTKVLDSIKSPNKTSLIKKLSLRRSRSRSTKSVVTAVASEGKGSVDLLDNTQGSFTSYDSTGSTCGSIMTSAGSNSLIKYPQSNKHFFQGFLYNDNSRSKKKRKYYVIDSDNNKFLIYHKMPTSKNSLLLSQFNLSDLVSCERVNPTHFNSIDCSTTESSIADTLRDSSTKSKNYSNKTFILKLTFSSNDTCLYLSGKDDDETLSWYDQLQQYISLL